jgi:hypothetical protein
MVDVKLTVRLTDGRGSDGKFIVVTDFVKKFSMSYPPTLPMTIECSGILCDLEHVSYSVDSGVYSIRHTLNIKYARSAGEEIVMPNYVYFYLRRFSEAGFMLHQPNVDYREDFASLNLKHYALDE